MVHSNSASAQKSDFEFSCAIHANHPYLSISKENLRKARTLSGLNRHYKPSWVAQYNSVEIKTLVNGQLRKELGLDSILTQNQLGLIISADDEAAIEISVMYIPKNKLSNNKEQEINFSIKTRPQKDAQFHGGKEALEKYLDIALLSKIDHSVFNQHQLTAIKFQVTETGVIIDPFVFQSSGDEATDQILIESICNMPNMIPARLEDGTSVQQEMVLTIGDMNSCVVNLLNISGYGVNVH